MINKQKEQSPKTFQRGKSYLMHLVSRSAKTSYEIRQKLRRSDYNEDIVDQVIEFGKNYDFIDDQSYTIRWLKSCASRKFYGKIKCIQELKKKGIDTEIINEQIELFFDDKEISEYQIALDYLSKKRHLIKGKDLYQQKQKASRILFQRGFSMDVINPVINDYFDSDFNSDNNNSYQKRIF
ncbi:MAG: regulatory protein RecX [Deltaproteobacteria bacterium]|jgi:regulatory protein|nr:regulatory protein RecX [Deltaproteobacteria bacterium]MBT4527230.1 regulatory protein RecX [Deltaproteobacteria bacterium]